MQVTLRPLAEQDTADVVRWRNDPFVRHNLYTQTTLTCAQHLNWFRTQVETGRCVQFVILLDGAPVGTTFLKNIDADSRKAEFGIFIGEPSARGLGVGTAATKLLLAHAFDTMGLHRVYLTVMADNFAGVAASGRAGFLQEGVSKDDYRRGDQFVDVIKMGLTETQWRQNE